MRIVQSTASFTRPADTTAYTAGDLVANSTTPGSVAPLIFRIPNDKGFGFALSKVRITLSGAAGASLSGTNTNAKFRVHLYTNSPTMATSGDNAAWSTFCTESGYLGDVDVDCTVRTFSDFVSGQAYPSSANVPTYIFPNVNGVIYALLEATAAYTPVASEIFTVSLVGIVAD